MVSTRKPVISGLIVDAEYEEAAAIYQQAEEGKPAPPPRGRQMTCQTPWGTFTVWSQDLIGRTLIGHSATFADNGKPFWTLDGQAELGAGELWCPFGKLWDSELLMPWFKNAIGWNGAPGLVVDIGANYGFWSVMAARWGCQVLAVEANKKMLWALRRNVEQNGVADKVQIVPGAAYDAEKILRMDAEKFWLGTDTNLGGTSFSESGLGWEVATVVLDSWVERYRERLVLVKCDAQGCDLRALRGLEKRIRADRPIIVFEFEEGLAARHGDDWMAYAEWMNRFTYAWTESATHKNNWIGVAK